MSRQHGGSAMAPGSLAAAEARLFWYKLVTFVGALGSASWGRFGAVYYSNLKGLAPSQIGVIELGMVLAAAIMQPLWGLLGDRTSKKNVFVVTRALSTAVLLMLSSPLASSFGAILAISVGQAAFSSDGVLRAAILQECGPHAPVLFGRVRLYGAAGWGVGALVMGVAADVTGTFDVNFAIYAALMAITVRVTWRFIPEVAREEPRRGAADAAGAAAQQQGCCGAGELGKALCRGSVLGFALETLVAGMGIGLVERMLFVYLQKDLGASTTLCGLSVFVTVLFEIPMLYYAGGLIQRYGRNACLATAYLCYSVRVLGYTLLTPATVVWILPLESLHGVTFAFVLSCFVETARQISPRGWEATVQTLANTMYARLGGGLGALAGGVVFDIYGARTAYRGAGAVIGVFCLARAWLSSQERGALGSTAPEVAYSKLPPSAPEEDTHLDPEDLNDDLREDA